jgi:hypothetical protein
MRAPRTRPTLLSTNLQTDGESDAKHVMVAVSQCRSQFPAFEAPSFAVAATEAESSQGFRKTRRHPALIHESVSPRSGNPFCGTHMTRVQQRVSELKTLLQQQINSCFRPLVAKNSRAY